MKIRTTYTNEFTGEVFTDREKCEWAERESKTDFINKLIGDMDLIKDICNNASCCSKCPFSFYDEEDGDIHCLVSLFTDKYLDIVHDLNKIAK